MKFDKLAENIINEMLTEGRLSDKTRYSNLKIDKQAFLDKIEANDFDDALSSLQSNSARYGGKSVDSLKVFLKNIAEDSDTVSDYDDLWELVSSKSNTLYEDKGPRRNTFTTRLTKAIIKGIILNPSNNLVTKGTPTETTDTEMNTETENEIEMTEFEEAIYNFVRGADGPTDLSEIQQQFPNSEDSVESLIKKGFLEEKQGKIYAKDEFSSGGPLPDFDEDEGPYAPLDALKDLGISDRMSSDENPDDYFINQ